MKRWRPVLAIAGGCAAAAVLACAIWVHSLGPVPLGKNLDYSHVVLDRQGRLLRAYATSEGRWRLPVNERDVDLRFLKLLFAYEDKRFSDHPGVDALALGRAAVQFISRGRIVSGGSTISMQVARLLEPRERRGLGAKLRQIVRALELERALGKDGVLALYLTLAPYGEISRAFARRRSPISARSRASCRWPRRRYWLPCRNRLNCVGPIVSRVLRAPRATVCSTGPRWRVSWRATKSRAQNPSRSRTIANHCRFWHRMR
jgi:hypothetical protein